MVMSHNGFPPSSGLVKEPSKQNAELVYLGNLVLGEVLRFSACFGSISMQVASRNFYEILGCWNLDLPMITVLCQGEAFTVPRGSSDACRQPSCFSFLVLDIKSLKYQKMEEVCALQVCSETAYCSPAG